MISFINLSITLVLLNEGLRVKVFIMFFRFLQEKIALEHVKSLLESNSVSNLKNAQSVIQ